VVIVEKECATLFNLENSGFVPTWSRDIGRRGHFGDGRRAASVDRNVEKAEDNSAHFGEWKEEVYGNGGVTGWFCHASHRYYRSDSIGISFYIFVFYGFGLVECEDAASSK
jgi:hypothetical protein